MTSCVLTLPAFLHLPLSINGGRHIPGGLLGRMSELWMGLYYTEIVVQPDSHHHHHIWMRAAACIQYTHQAAETEYGCTHDRSRVFYGFTATKCEPHSHDWQHKVKLWHAQRVSYYRMVKTCNSSCFEHGSIIGTKQTGLPAPQKPPGAVTGCSHLEHANRFLYYPCGATRGNDLKLP